MTTAGKPTFEPAKGGSGKNEKLYNILSKQFSSRDLPAQLTLKTRLPGQGSVEEFRNKDFKKDLLEREYEAKIKKLNEEEKIDGQLTYDDEDDPVEHSGGGSESSGSDDEEETAALLAELHRIRKERAEAKSKKEAEERNEAEKTRINQMLTGNPLLNQESSNYLVKRRWNDDVIFQNCAKDPNQNTKPQGFINDMLRSEFHKRFMDRYIK